VASGRSRMSDAADASNEVKADDLKPGSGGPDWNEVLLERLLGSFSSLVVVPTVVFSNSRMSADARAIGCPRSTRPEAEEVPARVKTWRRHATRRLRAACPAPAPRGGVPQRRGPREVEGWRDRRRWCVSALAGLVPRVLPVQAMGQPGGCRRRQGLSRCNVGPRRQGLADHHGNLLARSTRRGHATEPRPST
jgi:hypothetical protein